MILRTTSQRSRSRLRAALGRTPQYLFHNTWKTADYFAEVTDDEAGRLPPIPGITRARVPRSELRECWPAA